MLFGWGGHRRLPEGSRGCVLNSTVTRKEVQKWEGVWVSMLSAMEQKNQLSNRL